MGKGDKKSRKGKIFMGTYGVTRPRKTAEVIVIKKRNGLKKRKRTKVQLKRKRKLKKQLQKRNNFFQIKNIKVST